MIFQVPNLPSPGKERPRPIVLLAGSQGTSLWQAYAARELDRLVGSNGAVVRTDSPIRGVGAREGLDPVTVLQAIDVVAEVADLLVVWIGGGPVWLWLEMGVWLRNGGHRGGAKIIWGITEDMRDAASFHHVGHLLYLLEQERWPVFGQLTDTISAAAVWLQEARR